MGILAEIENKVKDDPNVDWTKRSGNDLRVFMNAGSVSEWEIMVKDGTIHAIERNDNGRVGGGIFEEGGPTEVANHILTIRREISAQEIQNNTTLLTFGLKHRG